MTGALLQLVSTGNEGMVFVGNPKVSFFKRTFLRHTNFSIERLELYNSGTSQLKRNSENVYDFFLDPQRGDLLYYLAFNISLPAIYAEYGHQFRWIENLGDSIITDAKLTINGTLIEHLKEPFFHVSNTLNLENNSKTIYDHLVQNLPSVNNPEISGAYPFSSSKTSLNTPGDEGYETVNKYYTDIPTINKQTLCIPIPFYINRTKDSFIPLTMLRQSKIHIQIKLRPLNELYTIGYPDPTNNYYHHQSVSKNSSKTILDFVKHGIVNLETNSSLYYHVIFLEAKEANLMKSSPMTHLITTPKKLTFEGLRQTKTIKLKNKDVIDSIYIIPTRSDIQDRNQWRNFSIYDHLDFDAAGSFNSVNYPILLKNWFYRDFANATTIDYSNIDYFKTSNIIKSLRIKLDGNSLAYLDSPNFFYNSNKFETFRNNFLKDLIIYKFSEYPLESQPSGHLNLADVKNMEIDVTFKDVTNDNQMPNYYFNVDVLLIVFKTIKYEKNKVTIY
mgnify:FL=1